MRSRESVRRRTRRAARVWADALSYAGVVTALLTVAAMTLGVATGGGFVRGNVFLFAAGWVLLAYATVRLWPSSPEDLEQSEQTGPPRGSPSRVQRFARSAPPARWVQLPAHGDRMSSAGKLFVSSIVVLCTSFIIEAVFGVG